MDTTEATKRGERTRSEILCAAHDLFIKQGYHGTSMRQIAEQAGVSLGAFYNHFESKEDIFRHVFLDNHPYHDVLPVLMTVQGETIEEFVTNAMNRMIAALENRPNYLNLLFIEVVEFRGIHAQELFSENVPQLMQIVENAVCENPEQLRSVPPMILLRGFLGLFFSYFLTETTLFMNTPLVFDENTKEYMIDIFLHGILKEND